MEIHAGIFQERRWDDHEQEFPAEWALWRSQDPDYRIPGGESRRDIMLRTAEAFEAIREAGYRRAPSWSRTADRCRRRSSRYWASRPSKIRSRWPMPRSAPSMWAKDFKLLSLNDTCHLRTTLHRRRPVAPFD